MPNVTKEFDCDESVSCNLLAMFELKLLEKNLVLVVEHGFVATAVVVNESTEYGLITHAWSHQLSNDFRDISGECVLKCA